MQKYFSKRDEDGTWTVLKRNRVTVFHVHSRDGRRVEERSPEVMRRGLSCADARELARKLRSGEVTYFQVASEQMAEDAKHLMEPR
jgi:hypothetical protein